MTLESNDITEQGWYHYHGSDVRASIVNIRKNLQGHLIYTGIDLGAVLLKSGQVRDLTGKFVGPISLPDWTKQDS